MGVAPHGEVFFTSIKPVTSIAIARRIRNPLDPEFARTARPTVPPSPCAEGWFRAASIDDLSRSEYWLWDAGRSSS
jgi:hypothetical protein